MRKQFNKGLKIIRYLVALLALITTIVILIQLIGNIKSSILLSTDGVNNLLTYYEPSIKFLTALIAVTAVWMTLERLAQTDKRLMQAERQMDLVSENNRFNNYLNHKKEFIEHFQNNIILQNYGKKNAVIFKSSLLELYSWIYYGSYNNFRPTLNERFQNQVGIFFKNANKFDFDSITEKFDIMQINEYSSKLSNIITDIPLLIQRIVVIYEDPTKEKIRNYVTHKFNLAGIVLENFVTIIVSIRTIFTAMKFISNIYEYDGTNIPFKQKFLGSSYDYFYVLKTDSP